MERPRPNRPPRTAKSSPGAGRRERRAAHGLSVLEDVGAIIAHSHDLQEALERIVRVVADRMETEVCSLYIYDPRTKELTLWATEGLNRASIGKVRMGVNEGLTGLVIERLEPVMVVDAIAHPRYKYFPETGEERYHSFLGVPVMEKRTPLGVLIVQTLRRRRFGADEVRLLKAIAHQVAAIIVQARLAESLQNKEKERQRYRQRMMEAIRRLQAYEAGGARRGKVREERPRHPRLVGLAASPGFGMGPAHVISPMIALDGLDELKADDPAAERKRFQAAVVQAIEQVERLKSRMSHLLPEVDAQIFDTHRLMLQDKGFLEKVHGFIDEGFAAEAALQRAVDEYVGAFSQMSDRYLRERASDVRDVGQRLLRILLGIEDHHVKKLPREVVLVAEELTLSDLAVLDTGRLKGIALATGGVTSHASILARSFEIPTVVGVERLLDSVQEDDFVIVDGNSGIVYVNPSDEVRSEYERLDREYRAFNRELESLRDLPAVTRDGHRVILDANVGLSGDLAFARRHGAEGVGLYRTEFPFLACRDFPDEDEQVDLYRRVIEEVESRRVTIRTLDLGADKYPSYLRYGKEENPFLGWRSIRISLELVDLFKTQLRAILRASHYGKVKLLLPMISSLEEVWRAKEILQEAQEELAREGLPFDEEMPLGIMIEVPSAVCQIRELLREVDFASLGTNDLIQYLLAVDRNNRKVASLYEPLHPAVLRAIHQTVSVAHEQGKWIGLCGEMAADPLCAPVLVGFGIDELSMGPLFVPVIKRLIRSVDYSACQEIAKAVLGMASVKEIKGFLFETMKKIGVIELMEIYH
jgi:phosphotransferase system enzyme I (PtsP)